ncbi:MAG TPA: sugar ABC transporter substrate-binding protein [Streptomyces sp.]|nr:sugar ABC transporter substrate-binding protein [Streptomyces sp.]
MNRATRFSRRTAVVAAAAAGVLLAAGCSSSSGGKQSQEDSGGAPAGKADTPRLKIALVTHAAPGDTFWDLVRKGAQTAAKKDNVELVYSGDPKASEQANLVQNAIDQKVDGIAVTLAKPDAMKGAVAKAQAAGIPVVALNAGLDAWKEQGVLSFFGQDDKVAGEAFGEKLNELGAKHNICVIHEQGHVGLEGRCAGVKKTFEGKTETLYVTGTDMPSVKSTITAKLRQDSSIDYVVTLGAPFAMTAIQSVADAGGKAKVATFDLNKDLAKAIKDGEVEVAVDQQPYLQGYLAVDTLWLYNTNGNFSGGGQQPVLTGPAFVDKGNIEDISKFAEKGTR